MVSSLQGNRVCSHNFPRLGGVCVAVCSACLCSLTSCASTRAHTVCESCISPTFNMTFNGLKCRLCTSRRTPRCVLFENICACGVCVCVFRYSQQDCCRPYGNSICPSDATVRESCADLRPEGAASVASLQLNRS